MADTPTPAAAKVAKPKAPAKKVVAAKKLEKAVADKTSGKAQAEKASGKSAAPAPEPRGNVKIPYNWRTRSLARFITDSIDDPADRKIARSGLRDLRTLDELRTFVSDNIDAKAWDGLLEAWFAAGKVED